MNPITSKLSEALKTISPENLKLIYEVLVSLKEKYPFANNEAIYNEAIQATVDFLIYGEKDCNYAVFEVFCELNFMGEFLHLFVNSHNRDIELHIIKAFALLILTLTDKRSIYYLFSHHCFSHILNSHFEEYGDDFLSYYINFIKSLALKIDKTTIFFFFQPKTNKFPLLESTLRLYNYPDPMIQNVVKNIFLTFLRLRNDLIYNYLCALPSVTYFAFIACRLRDLTIILNEIITKGVKAYDDEVFYNAKCKLDDMFDEILYLQDIFSLKIAQITQILINCLMYYWILPLLYQGLLQKGGIGFKLSLYLISVLFFYIRDEQMINILFIVFFYPTMNKALMKLMKQRPPPPKNYFFDWTDQLKAYKESTFQSHITYHYSKEYIRSLIKKPYLPYHQITPIVEKYEVHPLYHKKTAEEQYAYIIEDVFKFFSNGDLNEMSSYHSSISIATGVHIGLRDDIGDNVDRTYYSVISIITRLIDKTNKDKGIEDKFIANEARSIVFESFHSKEFTQSFIGNILLHIILESKSISAELFNSSSFLQLENYSNRIANNHQITQKRTNHNHHIDRDEDYQDSSFTNNYLKVMLNHNSVINHKDDSQLLQSELLSLLLNHFVTQNYMNSLSNLVILSNLASIFSYLQLKSPLAKLSNKDNDIINRTYYIFLSNIKLTLLTTEEIRQKAYSLFELTWLDYCKGIGDIIKNQMTLPDLLLPQPKTERISDIESFKGVLAIFIALYDLRVAALGLSAEPLLKHFPLSNANIEYSVGDRVNLLDGQIESFDCLMRKHCNKKFARIVFTLYLNYLFICKVDENDEYSATIEDQYPLRHISVLQDCINTKELFVDVKDSKGNLIEQMKLQLREEPLCIRSFNKIQEYIAYAISNESQMFEGFILKLMDEWELIK